MTHVFTAPHKGMGSTDRSGHEQVAFCQDTRSGLKAIIAIYSTALGPALGGTRFYPYGSEDEALADALRLSAAMAYKNALAGLDHGGGKAVIIGDPAELKTEALLRAYGRFVTSLGGRYITACDVGTRSEDMDVIARECSFVTGRTPAYGGAGDSSVLTALGVFQGMRAAAGHVWGSTSLRGRRVGIEGVGKVGRKLVGHLTEDGAEVVICDVSEVAVESVRARYPGVEVAAGIAELLASGLDVFSPCALGGAVDDQVAATLSATIICGGANNQLAHAGVEKLLADRGILVRAGLRRERRRRHPGRRRAGRLQLRAGEGARRADIRYHDAYFRDRGVRGRARARRGGPARGAEDVRCRKAPRHLARRLRRGMAHSGQDAAPQEFISVGMGAAKQVRLYLYGRWCAPHSRKGSEAGPFVVRKASNADIMGPDQAPDVRGGRANGARPSQGQAGEGCPPAEVQQRRYGP